MTARHWGVACSIAAGAWAVTGQPVASSVMMAACALIMALADIADRR